MKISSLLHRLNRRDTPLFPKIPNYTKFALIAISIIGLSILTKNIFAQTQNPSEYVKQKQSAIRKGNNQESWLNEAIGSNVISGINIVVGEIPDDVLDGKATTFIPGGVIGNVNKYTASLFNPPASGIQYIAQIKASKQFASK